MGRALSNSSAWWGKAAKSSLGGKHSLRILPFSKGDFAFFHKTEPEEASMWETFTEKPGFNTTLSSVFYRRLNQGRRRWRSHTNGKVCC